MSWINQSFPAHLLQAILLRSCNNVDCQMWKIVTEFDESTVNQEVLRSWFSTNFKQKKRLCHMLTMIYMEATKAFDVKDGQDVTLVEKNGVEAHREFEKILVNNKTKKEEKLGELISVTAVSKQGDPMQSFAKNLQSLRDSNATFPDKLEKLLPRYFAILWCMTDTDWGFRVFKDEALLKVERKRSIGLLQRILDLFRPLCDALTITNCRLRHDFQYLSILQTMVKGEGVDTDNLACVPVLEKKVLELIDHPISATNPKFKGPMKSTVTRMWWRESIQFTQRLRGALEKVVLLVFIGATGTGKTQQLTTFFRETNQQNNISANGERYTTDVSVHAYDNPEHMGTSVYAIDTPGLFDTQEQLSNMSTLLMSTLTGIPTNVVYSVSCCIEQIQPKVFNASDILKAFLEAPSRSKGRLLINFTNFDRQFMRTKLPPGTERTDVELRYAHAVAYVMQRIIYPAKESVKKLKLENTGMMYTVNVEGSRCVNKIQEKAGRVVCSGDNFKKAQSLLKRTQQQLNLHPSNKVALWKETDLLAFAESIKGQLHESLTLWHGLPQLFNGMVHQ